MPRTVGQATLDFFAKVKQRIVELDRLREDSLAKAKGVQAFQVKPDDTPALKAAAERLKAEEALLREAALAREEASAVESLRLESAQRLLQITLAQLSAETAAHAGKIPELAKIEAEKVAAKAKFEAQIEEIVAHRTGTEAGVAGAGIAAQDLSGFSGIANTLAQPLGTFLPLSLSDILPFGLQNAQLVNVLRTIGGLFGTAMGIFSALTSQTREGQVFGGFGAAAGAAGALGAAGRSPPAGAAVRRCRSSMWR